MNTKRTLRGTADDAGSEPAADAAAAGGDPTPAAQAEAAPPKRARYHGLPGAWTLNAAGEMEPADETARAAAAEFEATQEAQTKLEQAAAAAPSTPA